MHAGRWNSANLHRRIRGLSPGLTEICCHPRTAKPGGENHDWGHDPAIELAALTDPKLPQFLERECVRVTTFGEVFGQ
jgi:hypothetical protein